MHLCSHSQNPKDEVCCDLVHIGCAQQGIPEAVAVAIKLSSSISFHGVLKRYTSAGRIGVITGCVLCGTGYFLIFGPEMDEAEARQWFYDESRRDHPHRGARFCDERTIPRSRPH